MDHQRLIRLHRTVNVPPQSLLLHVQRRTRLRFANPVRVQTGLPDRHTPRIRNHLHQAGPGTLIQFTRPSRMNRTRRIYVGKRMRSCQCSLRFRETIPHCTQLIDARRTRALN